MTSPITTKLAGVLLACSILISQQPAFANPAPAPVQTFDLGSTARTQAAQGSGAVMIGGARMIVRPGQLVTPATFAALQQVATTGHQDLVLGASGAAVGGRVYVDSTLRNLGNLAIPNGVNALANFSNTSVIDIAGNLLNSGNLYAFASGTTRGAGTIGATNIYNSASGLISSVLPGTLAAGLAAAPVFDLSLHAIGDIVNAGTIRSSGALGLNAGGGVISNSGLIVAEHGNVTVSDAMRNVVFDNTGGTVQALNGCISVHTGDFAGNGNITLKGGDWLSQNLNLNAGGGDIEVAVKNVTGQVNSVAANEHILTDAPNLVLGSNIISGDPTFVNTGGNVVINGTVGNSTENIAIFAAGDITAGVNGEVIDHGFNVTMVAGAKLTINGGTSSPAGAPIGSVQLNNGSTVDIDFAGGTGGNIDLSGSTKAFVIDTSGDATNINGGHVVLAARASGTTGGNIFMNTAANKGGIDTTGGNDGSSSGAGGNVTIIAGANPAAPGETVRLNTIQTGVNGMFSGSSGGNVLIVTAQPFGSNAATPIVTFDSAGSLDSGSLSDISFTTTIQDTNIPAVRPNAQVNLFGTVATAPLAGAPGGAAGTLGSSGGDGTWGSNAGTITINSGEKVTATTINASGGGGGGGGGGSGGIQDDLGQNGGSGGIGGNAAAIVITSALGDIVATNISASGGAGGGGGGGGGAGIDSTLQGFGGSGGTGGQAAQITLQAGGVINVSKLLSRGGADGGTGGDGGYDDQSATPSFAGGGGGGGGGGASGGGTSSQGGGGGGGGQGKPTTSYAAGGSGGAAGAAGISGVGTTAAIGGGTGTAFGATGGTGGTAGSGPNGAPNNFPGTNGTAGGNRDVDNLATDVVPIVQLYGGTPDAKYLTDADYADRFTSDVAPTITRRSTNGNLTIPTSSPAFTTPNFTTGNTDGILFVLEDSGLRPILGSEASITPAEWLAVNQVGYTGSSSNGAGQILVLGVAQPGDTTANAVGGSFTTGANNMPVGGVFHDYTLPVGVINNVTVATLSTDGVTEIDGTLNFTNPAGATLNGDLVRIGYVAGAGTASVNASGAFLTIQSNPFQSMTLTNNGTISNTHAINVLGAAGEHLTIEGLNGVFDSNATKLSSQDDLFFSTGPTPLYTVLTFKGTATLEAGVGSTVFIGNTLNDISLTATKFIFNASQIDGNLGNLHTTGGGGSPTYIFNGGTLSNPTGNITIPKNITTTADLAILSSGDIIAATGVTKITGSSKTGNGANITIVAGYNFDGTASPGNASTSTYDNFTPNAAGGSVYLGKVNIDTSTKVAGSNGGSVTVVANAGTASPGAIYLGTTTTTGGTTGAATGGAVNMTAGGGISVGAISTKGATGGDVILQGSQPTTSTLSITNGVATGSITTGAPDALNGSGVSVKGAITTSGSLVKAGNVVAIGDAAINITSGIAANGTANGANGGTVTLGSLNSIVSVLGTGVNTSGGAIKSDVAAAGTGGAIVIGVFNLTPTAVQLSNLVTKGGANSGAGGAGDGGSVTISTATNNGVPYGPVTLSGYIDTRGGSETATVPVAGANGGAVQITSGLLAVKGTTSGASIIAIGGAGSKGAASGTGGAITIQTNSVPFLPVSFDLTSKTKSVPVLPGGLFTVMTPAPVNGTAGKIIGKGGGIINKSFAVVGQQLQDPAAPQVTVEVTGTASLSISDSQGAGNTFTYADASNKRILVTPAQAVALYQAFLNGDDMNTLVTDHTTGVATGGTILLTSANVNGTTFSAFKLPAVTTASSISIGGPRPALSIKGGLTIPENWTLAMNGTSTNLLELGTGALNVANGGTLSSTGTLVVSGSAGTLTDNGTITATTFGIARPSTAALTVNIGPTATAFPNVTLGPTLDAAVNIKFLAPKAIAQRGVFVNFGAIPLPTVYQAASAGVAAAANTRPMDTVTFGQGGSGAVGGALSAGQINILGVNNKIGTVMTPTSVTITDGTSLVADSKLNVNTTGKLTIGDTGVGAVGVNLSAGRLNPNGSFAIDFNNGLVLAKGDLLTAGTFTLTSTGAGGIAIGNANGTSVNFQENGAKLAITATVGDITFGNGNTFRAMGGNIVTLAKGNITGGANNKFQAEANGTTATGGIELSAGTTTSALAKAFAMPANNVMSASGIIAQAPPGTHHTLLVSATGVTGGNSTADFTNKGVVVLNALNTKTLTMGQNEFTTTSSKPVSITQSIDEEFVVDTDAE